MGRLSIGDIPISNYLVDSFGDQVEKGSWGIELTDEILANRVLRMQDRGETKENEKVLALKMACTLHIGNNLKQRKRMGPLEEREMM